MHTLNSVVSQLWQPKLREVTIGILENHIRLKKNKGHFDSFRVKFIILLDLP